MALRRSKGLLNRIGATEGFQSVMDGAFINVYSGTQPTTANDVAAGTLLFTISLDGAGVTGLNWEDVVTDGVVSKDAAQGWKGTAVAAGVAGWFRCFESTDDPALATTTGARFDGAIATTGAEINMTNTTIELAAVQTITAFTYTQPAQ